MGAHSLGAPKMGYLLTTTAHYGYVGWMGPFFSLLARHEIRRPSARKEEKTKDRLLWRIFCSDTFCSCERALRRF